MNKLNIPTSWNDVTLKQFIELKDLLTNSDNTNDFTNNINIISILCDTDIFNPIWGTIYLSELPDMFAKINFFNQSPDINLNKTIDDFILNDINNVTLGEFIDIDRFIQNDITNLSKICAILYRKYKHDEFGNIIIESYDSINLDERSKVFDVISINKVFGLLEYIVKFKHEISTNYSAIFEPNYSDEDDLEIDDIELENIIKKEKFQQQFSWELLLHNLSNGDLTKYNDILNLNFIFVMNQLSIKKAFNLD